MTDRATPNLPSRDLAVTSDFYARLGFTERYRDDSWMILERGALTMEFFVYRDVDPLTSSFSACLRLDDLASFYAACVATGLPETSTGYPRLHAPRREPWGGVVGALIDLDGTLLRLIQNEPR